MAVGLKFAHYHEEHPLMHHDSTMHQNLEGRFYKERRECMAKAFYAE